MPGLSPVNSAVREKDVPLADAAAIFALNIATWKGAEFIRGRYPEEEITGLETHLQQLARTGHAGRSIVWGLRQAAFQKTRGGGDATPLPGRNIG